MSARPILGHFCLFLMFFFVKTARYHKIFAENCDFFVILNTSIHFWCKIPTGGGGGNFQFSAKFWAIVMSTLKYGIISRD